MFLTDLSIKRPVVASVMSLILVIFGLLSYQDIPTDELPNVQPPIVTIQTIYKGIIPFVLLQLLGLALVIKFPEIALWLPSRILD